MSPASYQTAPPRVAFVRLESGKRDSNPRPQPWQGCALPTELFPRAIPACRPNVTAQSARFYRLGFANCLTGYRTNHLADGGEGDRTPDLVNAIHALSQLSYAPCILGPLETRPGGNTASYRDVVSVSSEVAP